MVQRKLDYYFQHSAQPKNSSESFLPSYPSPCVIPFLDLPYQIRRRVYILLGLVRFCPVNLNQEGPRAWHYLRGGNKCPYYYSYVCLYQARRFSGKYYQDGSMPSCRCPPLPVALLLVCRTMSEEASHILYSENSFTICKSDSWGFKPLRNLNSSALSSLRTLTVRLNRCDCLYIAEFETLRHAPESELEGFFSCHPFCKDQGFHDKPLRNRARQHAVILQEWQDIVARFATHCRLESMRLDFICDTQDMETAKHVISQLSPLQNIGACSIRLSQKSSWLHAALARETSRHLVGHLSDQHKPMSYHLPPEILTHILGYSELIAPFDLEWRPEHGLVPFDCCKKCTVTLDCCTCLPHQGAYSETCTCWKFPLSIFLVSRQVYNISKTIFYQRNHFVILPKGEKRRPDRPNTFIPIGLQLNDRPEDFQNAYPAVADFFTRLPPDNARLLRSLGVLVPFPETLLGDEYGGTLAKWRNSVRIIYSKCDTANLRLAVFLGYPDRWISRTLDEHNMRSAYTAFADPLREMKNLRDLFVYVEWPMYSMSDNQVRLSSILEKKVLGSDYDSASRGKWDRLFRLWYNQKSTEGPVYAPNGHRIWPHSWEDLIDPYDFGDYTY